MPTMPDELNRLLIGLQETRQDAAVRSAMDAGPSKARRRYSAAYRQFSGQVVLQGAEIDIMDVFYRDTLAEGSLIFDMTDPKRNVPVQAMFAAPPQYTHGGADITTVSIVLEIQP